MQSLVQGRSLNHDFYMDFLEQKKLSDASRFATVIVKLNAKYNPSNLYLIEQHIRRVFESTGSPLSSFQYPHEYILIAEKKALEKALDQMKELADTYHDILTIGIGSDHALMHQNRSYREADIARKACIGGINFAMYDTLNLEIIMGSIGEDVRHQYAERILGKLDEKAIRCLRQYFDCACHLKEAASLLFIHEKTLKYQLERVKKLTGYDPTHFQDAVTLYFALLVSPQYPNFSSPSLPVMMSRT